ncbi:hypothetical protein FIU97_17555 [Roseivivax sp. THAF40]|uniref:DUF599 domain-containing protein n=1 Tax=unclassified Roseivivax TaxID=2639302 RepID=UPI001268A18F|nr:MULTISPECIES: DUF599 domain-containing protein [unclassified Roseivivax]QFS84568.1 hypothetical protein FIV09_17145 [Roseivivax sp. THAF197b]QFT48395.1 hypothetical protein FIU97_17555 [Roseivivax sp. THAF40]
MTPTLLQFMAPADWVALGVLITGWLSVTQIIENPPAARPSTSILMAEYRRAWMVQFLHRDPRIFDSQIVGILRQGATFFASATMIAIGGALALIGNADRLQGVARDLTLPADPTIVWEVKIALMLLFAVNAFLKFVWSHRLFGYCAVLMAAVPNDPADRAALARARQAGEINSTAARSYNRGMRSVYFGIASAAWMIGPIALMLATALTVAVILRREFFASSRAVLLTARPEDTEK